MDISKIRPKIKNKKPKRCGRGSGSGLGKTSGRGHKGAGQRSGKKLPYIGFRGGNIPYIRKLPKRGFSKFNKFKYQIVNLKDIAIKLSDKKEINPEVLKKAGLIKDEKKAVKILAKTDKEFTQEAVFFAHKFSNKAKELIQKANGRVEIISKV